MPVPTALPSRPPTAPVAIADLVVLASLLEQHRRVRADQVEALVCTGETSAADAARALLGATEAALARVGDGTYGRCTLCAGRIPTDRLYADPLVTACPACAGAS